MKKALCLFLTAALTLTLLCACGAPETAIQKLESPPAAQDAEAAPAAELPRTSRLRKHLRSRQSCRRRSPRPLRSPNRSPNRSLNRNLPRRRRSRRSLRQSPPHLSRFLPRRSRPPQKPQAKAPPITPDTARAAQA